MGTVYYVKRLLFLVALILGSFSLRAQDCVADAGTFASSQICLQDDQAKISATPRGDAVIPDGYETLYVLTSGEELVIQNVNEDPSFDVELEGLFTIHTLVYDPATLDLGIVELGVTTGFDVNSLIIQGGGTICAALDVAGSQFKFGECEPSCEATPGMLVADMADCLQGDNVTITAEVAMEPTVPEGFEVIYVLTSGEELVIENVNAEPTFDVAAAGLYTIHTLVYDPETLDLGIVVPGETTGVDVNGLLIQGGGNICAALDVAGAPFNVEECPECEAWPGTLIAATDDCLEGDAVTITAERTTDTVVPEGFEILYVLTSGTELIIENVNAEPTFDVAAPGLYTIHTLVYNPETLDLSIVVPGETTGFDVNSLLIQGGGDICAALDVAGAPFNVEACEPTCEAGAGMLTAATDDCLQGDDVTITAEISMEPTVPEGYEVIYVLTSGEGLVIENVNADPTFDVMAAGLYTIHTLVYDPATLDLGIVVPGETTGFDVNGLLVQGGGDICAALDVAGAPFNVEECDEICEANAGTLSVATHDCLEEHEEVTIRAKRETDATVPNGFELIYVLTSGEELVIENVSDEPSFDVTATGLYTIHTLVYDPSTLDLGIVEPGITTGFDVNGLLIQGGGTICAALDVAGAKFNVEECVKCEADAGLLEAKYDPCSEGGKATLEARVKRHPHVPEGFEVIYVLTSGHDLVIEDVAYHPTFVVNGNGTYRIHTLVYDPETLDLSIVEFGETTGFDVNQLLIQGGGLICGALDVDGALFEVEDCDDECLADAGSLKVKKEACIEFGKAKLKAEIVDEPFIPNGYEQIYVLTTTDDLVILAASYFPEFEVKEAGTYRIHSLVYNPNTLDLSIIEPGVTTGFDVNSLLIQGGGQICASLDVPGALFHVQVCPEACFAKAGELHPIGGSDVCLEPGASTTLEAATTVNPNVPAGYEVLYVLTSGEGLVIQGVNAAPKFEVSSTGRFTIHTLVYDPNTLDLSIVEPGVTTGFDVNSLLIQGGGKICAALDVAGAKFDVEVCCEADAGRLRPANDPCLDQGSAVIRAEFSRHPHVPHGFEVIYVLTAGEGLVIQNVNTSPEFEVNETGRFTIHTLVYNPETLDLGIVVPGQTTGFDVNGLLIQGGGSICAALDVAGAPFHIEDCCKAGAGTLSGGKEVCLENEAAVLAAQIAQAPTVPQGFEVLYVLTSGEGLVIEQVNTAPTFTVAETGLYTIHTLVYDPATLDLSIVVPGQTTGFDVNGLLIQGGGTICAALDVAGTKFDVVECCKADAGRLVPANDPCLGSGSAMIKAKFDRSPNVPAGFELLYVLTAGEGLVIQNVNTVPEFEVSETGRFTIHGLVYDPATLDLSIVVPGQTTGFDVNSLLIQGGGSICASLDVAGAVFNIQECCQADAGTLNGGREVCLEDGQAELRARRGRTPTIPEGFERIYVLTSGEGLVIENVNTDPSFTVDGEGLFTIHTLVYNPETLDLGIVEPGVTTGFDVNSLLIQGGGSICASLDVAGAAFTVKSCTSGMIMNVRPNPTTEMVNLDFEDINDVETITVELVDALGQIQRTVEIEGGKATTATIDLGNSTSGTYYLKVFYDERPMAVRKIVKQ